ncbi:MAG TPA: TonB-dependent receptor [Steroidobacteraceae bacterium]|nr:TonB-dependent receptor [Steroidobacteraceae bacterium]
MKDRSSPNRKRFHACRGVLPVAAVLTPLSAPVLAQTAPAVADTSSDTLQEVIVTATRHEESIQKVPISVQAFSQEQMDAQGVKQLDDLVRLTPGLSLNRNAATGASQIAIRGISSAAGSGTTGIYIDDTPIQVRNLGYGAGTAFPGMFDIERVEVLRGPQGTLFGAGSEGGTVRFIQTEPSLTKYSTYDRAEVANTQNGAPSYEAGGSFGGPIVADRIGFRVSAFYRYDGGYIDAVNGTYQVNDPSGALYGKSVTFTPTSTFENNINWAQTIGARIALKVAVNDDFTASPSVFYQKRHINDAAGASYWLSQSDPGSQQYSRPFYIAGSSATDPSLTDINAPNNQKGDDEFTLSALRLDWNLGAVQMISNSSFFARNATQWYDYTQGYVEFYNYGDFIDQNGNFAAYPPPGWKSMAEYINSQRNFVQELRFQSNDQSSRFHWVAGGFYSHNKQTAAEPISVNWLQHAGDVGFGPGLTGYTNGDPYGPGSTAYENFLGVDLLPNSVTFDANWQTVDQQLAAFAQTDFDITSQLKLTVGLRFSHTKLDYDAKYFGGDNNANAPFGYLLPGTTTGEYAVGTGPYAPVYPVSAVSSSNNAWTPKAGLSYQIDDNNMVYTTVAKGFRPAGANLQAPTVCDQDLTTYGYTDSSGKSTEPATYKPDTVWSYEVGSKNRLLDGHLVLDASAYIIKWKNIQTDVFLPDCAYDFVDNLASATAKGFDLGFEAKPLHGLTFGGAIGYTKATFDRDALSPSGEVLFVAGSGVPNSGPPWTVSVNGEYDFDLFSGRDFYIRADYTYSSTERRFGPMVQGDPQYDPLLFPNPSYSLTNARLGWRVAGLDVSLFVNNLTGAHPWINNGTPHSTYYDPQDWYLVALRPRTYGLTVTYRN